MQSRHLYNLLLIEDVDDLQSILQFCLEAIAGWRVVTKKSNQDWLETASIIIPDIILIDRYTNGVDVLTQLKGSKAIQDIPVICLVSRDRLADQLLAKQEGAAAIIAKPFDPLVLVRTIVDVLESSSPG